MMHGIISRMIYFRLCMNTIRFWTFSANQVLRCMTIVETICGRGAGDAADSSLITGFVILLPVPVLANPFKSRLLT